MLLKKIIKKYYKPLILIIAIFVFPKITNADDVFRVTEYNITNFSSTSYNLSLNNALSPNHFIMIRGAESGNVLKSPTNSYVKISKLPYGANKHLPTTGSDRLLELQRYATGNSSWVGVVTIVECLADCDKNGFKTLDIMDLSTPKYTSTTTRLQSGTILSNTAWSNINNVSVFGGAFGSGTNIEDSSANSGYYNSGWLRLYPSNTNTINWERYNSNNDGILSLASHNVYVIQWGSEWNVQRVNISGTNGGSASDATSEYNTSTISSVTRANTWVYGSGYSQAAAIGNGAFGTIVTLGNGVAKNTSETKVAIGSQISGVLRSFDVYTMSHPSLSVDYQFKANAGGGSKTATVTTTSNANTSARMAMSYSSINNNTNYYPASIFSSRYTANTTITLQREYYPTGTSYAFATWVQGINWKNIQYIPQPTLNQYKYRWRDDTKSLNESNGWLADYNTNIPLVSKNTNYRIRFAISNTGENDTTTGRSIKIQYGYKVNGSCSNVTTWTDLASTQNITMSASSYYNDQDSTSMIFDNPESYFFTQGKGMDTSNTSNQIALLNNRFTELEYSIKVPSTSSDGIYCLRLFNSTDNKAFASYSIYPEMLVGSYLTQSYYRWYENNNLITPVNALSLENSESFISENEIARLRLNIQAKQEALDSKSFILQYSKNSINGPWKTVSNPTTNAKWWNNNYAKRQKIGFGTSHSLLPIGLTVSLTMNTQVAQNSGDDVRIVYQKNNGESYELDRIADSWYSTNSKIDFKLLSEVAINTAYSSDGDYYVYYGNSNAVNPPTSLSNVYAVYDDFNDGAINSNWRTEDHDKVAGTSFTETNGNVNINAGGVDTWTSVDDYAALYQDNIDGDFEVTLKCVYQDSIATGQNIGLMIKNDITKTQSNNGYFITAGNAKAAYISAWDSDTNGYLDNFYYSTSGITWPNCVRIKKQGTTFTSTYSADCNTFTAMNTRTISDASNVQDVGMYILSNGGDILSLGKFDYFKLVKLVSVNPTTSLQSVETKEDWEFYDSVNLNQSVIISQVLLSNSNTGELYSEVNPLQINPNIIQIDKRGEYDFALNSKNAEKTTYYFKIIRSAGNDLEQYDQYAKITVGNILSQTSYRWYANTNSIDAITPLAAENTMGLSDSKSIPVRLRINVKNKLAELKQNSTSFVLQYSKTSIGPWSNVAPNNDWEFYDNNSVDSGSSINSLLLSTSNKKEVYSEQNPTTSNINNLLDNETGEYDFSIIPKNATGDNYYFRLIKSNGEALDSYNNYPRISVNTESYYNLAAYKIFKNTDSENVGNQVADQNSKGSIEANSEFRLRILMSVLKNKLTNNNGFFKLQFAEKGTGTCASPEYAYSIITRTTAIGLKDNASVADNIPLVSNVNDPVISGATIRNQTYKELGDFSNSVSDINTGEYGQWDFSLIDNNAGIGKTFCFKVTNMDGTDIQSYSNYPEISISSGVLSIDIVDNNGNSIDNPIFNLDSKVFSYSSSSSQGIFGFDNQKIRISNSTSNPSWTVSLSATYGESAYWTNGSDKYDFNDPTANAEDGFDADDVGGQMSIDPSFGSITPKSGSLSNGISLASSSSFIEGSQNSITIATSSSTAQTNSYWDIMGVTILQSIPASQKVGSYSINMTLTIIGN